MDARSLITMAQEKDRAAVEPLVVPEWGDAVIKIRPVSAIEVAGLETAARQFPTTTDPAFSAEMSARWLRAGIVDPQLSSEDVAALQRTGNAACARVENLIRIKTYGIGDTTTAEEWAIKTLAAQSPAMAVLVAFYNRAKAGGGDFVAILRDCLTEGAQAPTLEALTDLLDEGWQRLVDAQRKVSSPEEDQTG